MKSNRNLKKNWEKMKANVKKMKVLKWMQTGESESRD